MDDRATSNPTQQAALGRAASVIGSLLAAGWLLLTLGIWGAVVQTGPRAWWIWPLSLGIAALLCGGTLLWTTVQALALSKLSSSTSATDSKPRAVA